MITAHVMRVYQSLAKPYIALANAFKSGNLQKLNGEVELAKAIWDSVSRWLIAEVASFHSGLEASHAYSSDSYL